MIEWTAEEIAKRSDAQVKGLRENAARLGHSAIVDLCDVELSRRKPVRARRETNSDETRAGHYVSEFHFVCPGERGVTRNPDGTISTGVWVVATANAKAGEKFGSLVALHAEKAQPSYIQGIIKSWQRIPRDRQYADDQLAKIRFGVEFQLEATKTAVAWQGEASGEKGYAWLPIPSSE